MEGVVVSGMSATGATSPRAAIISWRRPNADGDLSEDHLNTRWLMEDSKVSKDQEYDSEATPPSTAAAAHPWRRVRADV